MAKSIICIICAILFIVINISILLLKPEVKFAQNDQDNYCVYFQKWIGTVVFMATIIMAIFCLYFAINMKIAIAYFVLFIECILAVIYALVKYKIIIVSGDEIHVERLFCKDLHIKFSNISLVTYIPNAKIVIKAKRKESFDVSFNSENFYTFYHTLLEKKVKFKTGRIPSSENHVYLSKYNMTIHFPKTMFREFYQSKNYLRNSKYLFSARSLENNEYIEGYYKESSKELSDFIDIIKNDLTLNGFNYVDKEKENIDGFDFTVIKALNDEDKDLARLAYIYQDVDNYFVIYADYLKGNEELFISKMKKAIQRAAYEDSKNSIAKI